jgi:NitT/TauT family transport system permease protein
MIERLLRIAAPLILIGLWELVVDVHLLDERFFPAPSGIVETFWQFIVSGEFFANTWITLQRVVIGFLIGAIPGVVLGLFAGTNRYARAVLDSIVALLYPIPKIAILPLVLLIFGVGEEAKWALVAIGVFFIMFINTESGVRQIDPLYLDVAKMFRLRPASFYGRVVLPGSLPNIFTGLKLSVGIAIVLAVAAEFSASKSGLGYVIWNGWQTLQVERMYVALVVVSALGYLLTIALDGVERLALPWKRNI